MAVLSRLLMNVKTTSMAEHNVPALPDRASCRPLLSIIIPAWNEESILGPTLQAVRAATGQLAEPSEIIVVNDSSTDRTAEIAQAHGARLITVHCRQIAATRNAGAREARGDLFLFIDADTIVTPEAVGAAVMAMRAGAVGGGCAIRYSGRLPTYLRIFVPIEVWFCRVLRIAFGCFFFSTRQAFEAVGGFDTRLYATEEVTLSRALKRQGRFVFLRECVSTSGRKLRTHSLSEWMPQLFRITIARRKYIGQRSALGLWYGDRRPDPELKLRIVPQFRRASPDEISLLEELQRRTAMISDYREEILAHPDAVEISLQAVVDGHARVALLANKVIGFSMVLPSGDGRAELDGLFVEPEFMRRGVGRALLEDACSIARAQGVHRLDVTSNRRAVGFYERLGFVADGPIATRFETALRMHIQI